MNSIVAMGQTLFKCVSMNTFQAFDTIFLVAVSLKLTSMKGIPDLNAYKQEQSWVQPNEIMNFSAHLDTRPVL